MAALCSVPCAPPAPASAARVAAVPYDVVNTEEARALADGNPLSFLHVSRAEIDLPAGTESVRRRGVHARRPRTSRAARPTRPSWSRTRPALYVYRLRMGAHEQTGVAACFSVDEYDRDVDQEAREDAAGQGGRSHAPHPRAARADRPRVPDLRARRAVDADRRARHGGAAALRLHGARRHRAHDLARGRRATSALVAAFARDPGALHRRRPSSRGERRARHGSELREARHRRPRRTWRCGRRFSAWPFPTTRCRSCRITAS